MAKCIVCGAARSTCGPRTTVVPVDSNISERSKTMGELKRYEVEIPGRGGPRKTTLLLSDEDAKAQNLKPAGKAAPANKSRTASANKSRSRASKPRTTKAAESATKPVESKPVEVTEPADDK